MVGPKTCRKRPNHFDQKTKRFSYFMKLNKKRLNFFPGWNVYALTDLVKLNDFFWYFLKIYHLRPKRISFLIFWRWGRRYWEIRFFLNLLFTITHLKIRIWCIRMWMAINFFVNIFNLKADLVVIIFIISLMKVHIQRKLSLLILLIVINVIDFLRQKGLIAHAHCINFVVKIIFLQLRIIASFKVVFAFCHSDVLTVGFSFAQLAAKLRLRRLTEFQLF